MADQLGLIDDLTRLMLRQSLTQQRAWAAAGWSIPVSVNVGPGCVADESFPAVVADLARQLLSVALWVYLLGDLIQLYYEEVLHRKPYPTWADAAYLSFYVVAFAGLLTFPSRQRTRAERYRLLLDAGTVFVAGATLIWYVALGPAVAADPSYAFHLPDLVTFANPIGDLLLLFGVLALLWRGVPRSSVTSLRIFATGLLVFIAADVTYDYITVHSSYTGGDPVDTLWIVALIILIIAAGTQLRARQTAEFTGPGRPTRATRARCPTSRWPAATCCSSSWACATSGSTRWAACCSARCC